jgi:hypothetical protein
MLNSIALAIPRGPGGLVWLAIAFLDRPLGQDS